jgi:hypothetical protein
MRPAITAIGVAALLALGACGNKKDGPATAAGSGSAIATSTGGAGSGSATGSGSPASDGSAARSGSAAGGGSGSAVGAGSGSTTVVAVPTEVDFEKDASARITDKNVEAQVQALEKELETK